MVHNMESNKLIEQFNKHINHEVKIIEDSDRQKIVCKDCDDILMIIKEEPKKNFEEEGMRLRL